MKTIVGAYSREVLGACVFARLLVHSWVVVHSAKYYDPGLAFDLAFLSIEC